MSLKNDQIDRYRAQINLKRINISTKPYPGFPTDLQGQLMVLMTQVSGKSEIKENIFEKF